MSAHCRAPASRLSASAGRAQLGKLPEGCGWVTHTFSLAPGLAGQAVTSIGLVCSQIGATSDYTTALGKPPMI